MNISEISVLTGTLIYSWINSCSGVADTTTNFPFSVICSSTVGVESICGTEEIFVSVTSGVEESTTTSGFGVTSSVGVTVSTGTSTVTSVFVSESVSGVESGVGSEAGSAC